MEIITQLKKTIVKLIEENKYEEACLLVKKAAAIDMEWDAEMYYFAAIVIEYEGLYALSIAYIKQAIILEPDNSIFKEYYDGISFGKVQWNDILDIAEVRKNKKRILLVEGVFDTLDLFTDEFVNTFEYLGYECCVHNYKKEDSYAKMISFISKARVDFVFFFNNTGLGIDAPMNKKIVSILKCTKINILVDHPAFTLKAVKEYLQNNDFVECVVDRDHVKYLDEYKGIVTRNRFIPHGGKALNIEIKPLSQRKIGVLYVGSTKKYPKLPDELNEKCLEEMILNPNMSSIEAIKKVVMEEYSIEESDVDLLPNDVFEVLHQNEWVALGFYRTETIKALVESGIKVNVYGLGWDQVDFANNPNLIIGDLLTPFECIEKMYDSVIVLNSMPWFKDGTHERIFNAMLAGSIVVTDKSKWLEENFIDGENIISFDLKKIDKMVNRVEKIIANVDEYQSIADEGYKTAVARHTWSHRALEVINMM